eukprot:CAMPEP_0176479274 /NCGR_PEP_ID=MMETSP0200_2-20121128/1651_1 /TAXON_ID=947934 /ORGANISM="Chaetoceros sp., Strain GSL56" /LENGTH=1278 /DNA_ID=CAMNT_0017875305 /DNA_START=153 /DNA_END=3985 /DNA_ORIENTATION=+
MKTTGTDRDYPSFSSSSKYRKVKYEDEVLRSAGSSSNGGHTATSRNSHYNYNKYGGGGDSHHNTMHKPSRRTSSSSPWWSTGSTILKIITVILVFLAAAICYLSQLNSQDQQRVIQKIKSKASTAMKGKGAFLWDNVSFKYYNNYSPSSRRHFQIHQVETGVKLLKNNDAVGAESICKSVTERDPSNMKAWVCLGEARLALFNSVWSSGLVGYPSEFMFEKLIAARENFEMATSMNQGPTCPEARLGLGLTLFLMATRRMEETKRYSNLNKKKKESTSQLLFDSILHLNAAASLTSPSALMGERREVVEDKKKIHMAATYNSAVAHLALGDTSTAAPLLEEVISTLQDEEKKNNQEELDEKGEEEEYRMDVDSLIVVVPKLNFVGTLLQRGAWKKAAATATGMVDTRYCMNTEQDGQTDGKVSKLCSIILNNAAIIKEEGEGNGDEQVERYYRKAVKFERDHLLIQGGFSSINYKESGMILHRGEKDGAHGHHVQTDSFDKKVNENKGSFLSKEGSSRITAISDFSSQSLYDAISTLEESALRNPMQSRLWLSLSKVKLRTGDRIGAVEAATNALNSAKTVEEMDTANSVLDAALTHHHHHHHKFVPDALSSSIAILQDAEGEGQGYPMDEPSYLEALHLEREILILKLQMLQESLQERDDGMQVQSSKMPADTSNIKDSSYVSTTSLKEPSLGTEHVVPVTHEESDREVDTRNENVQVSIEDLTSIAMEESADILNSDRHLEDEEKDENTEESDSIIMTNFPTEEEEAQTENKVTNTIKDAEKIMTPNLDDVGRDSEDVGHKEVETKLEFDDEQERIMSAESPDGEENLLAAEQALSQSEELQNNEINYDVGETEALLSGEMKSGIYPYNVDERVEVPNLYQAEDIPDEQVSSSALSYMKMADAYLQKQNFKSASKQFMKVLKKFPFHIPALLGYASSLERVANSRQLVDVVMAYTNVTRSALALGNQNLADASLRRATTVSRNIQESTVEVLREIARLSFTYELAAEAHFELGMEFLTNNSSDSQNEQEAITAFLISNEYARRNTDNGVHGKSLLQLGKLALDRENNPKKALFLLDQASSQDLGDLVVEYLVYSARAKYSLGDSDGATVLLERAIAPESPRSDTTALAYHLLAVIMRDLGVNSVEVERNMEMALNLGLDVTPEAIEALGEHNIAVIKSIHRAEWKRYQQSAKHGQQRQGGGIMSGVSSVSSTTNSVFAPQGAGGDGPSLEEDALTMLEQGAASYDGSSIPIGGEVEGDSVRSINVNHQSRAKVNSR